MAIGTLRDDATIALRRFVGEEGADFPAITWVWRALATPGKLLGPQEGYAWGLLPLLVCEAAGGDPRRALPLGVAFECFISAADVLDDIQDDDTGEALHRACGIPTATNVATFLLFLTQIAIGRLTAQGIPCATVTSIGALFAAAGARACGGQQVDLNLGDQDVIDEPRYLEMVARKSGSLVACACRAGALLATTDVQVVDAYDQFGANLGIALQIGNDLAAATGNRDRGDLRGVKCTLALIYALRQTPTPIREELATLVRADHGDQPRPAEIDRLRQLLATTGAVAYVSVVADVYWERALTCPRQARYAETSALVDMVAQWRGI